MKKNYTSPSFEILQFVSANVISTSGTGQAPDMPWNTHSRRGSDFQNDEDEE